MLEEEDKTGFLLTTDDFQTNWSDVMVGVEKYLMRACVKNSSLCQTPTHYQGAYYTAIDRQSNFGWASSALIIDPLNLPFKPCTAWAARARNSLTERPLSKYSPHSFYDKILPGLRFATAGFYLITDEKSVIVEWSCHTQLPTRHQNNTLTYTIQINVTVT